MAVFTVLYLLVFAIFALVGYAILQIKLFGMNVKDFWGFIEANQILDRLYNYAKYYEKICDNGNQCCADWHNDCRRRYLK